MLHDCQGKWSLCYDILQPQQDIRPESTASVNEKEHLEILARCFFLEKKKEKEEEEESQYFQTWHCRLQ